MRANKRKQLESKGWTVGTVAELLDLSAEDIAFVELKVSLSQALRSRREKQSLSQTEVATLISSSQSRVAKMEGGDPSVSLDLIIKTLLALGTTRKQLAKVISA